MTTVRQTGLRLDLDVERFGIALAGGAERQVIFTVDDPAVAGDVFGWSAAISRDEAKTFPVDVLKWLDGSSADPLFR